MVDYEETIEYFSPYKDHAFIRDLGAFVDGQGMNASMNVYVPLLQYAVSSKEKGECIGNIQSYVFQTDEAFYNFLENLHRFMMTRMPLLFLSVRPFTGSWNSISKAGWQACL